MPKNNLKDSSNQNKNTESLNNILLDENTNNKKVSIKKVILVGIIAFTVFIAAIFSVKYFPSLMNKANDMKDSQEDVKIKLNKQSKEDKDNNLFEDVDIKQNEKVSDKFRNIINNIKNDKTLEKKNEEQKNENKKNEKISQEVKINKKKEKSKIKIAPQKNSLIKEKQDNFIEKGYYIQVGSFSRKLTSSNALLDKVKNNSYKYSLFKVKLNNRSFIKVVIGPYETKKDAIMNLPKIKQSIESDAYILALP